MKFSLLLILPCFLTISAASFDSFATIEGATFADAENSSMVASAQAPNKDTAHRGSGRRDIMASSWATGTIA